MCFEMLFEMIIFRSCDWAQRKQEFPPTPPALDPEQCHRRAEDILGYLTEISKEPVVHTHAASPQPRSCTDANRTTSSYRSIVILLLWGATETGNCKVRHRMTTHLPWTRHVPSELCHHLNFISKEFYSHPSLQLSSWLRCWAAHQH